MMIFKKQAKKLFAGLFAVVMAFVMTGCGSNPLLKAYEDALVAANTTLAEAKDLVAIPNADAITTDLVLPTQVVRDDWEVSVRWASSNPTVVSTTGEVARQSADTDVTLTATLNYFYNYGGADTPSASVMVADTKVFTVTVVAAPVAPTPTTVALAFEAENATTPDSTTHLLEGVVVGVNEGDGFFLNDGTGQVYVYSTVVVEVGDLVRVNAHKVTYYGMPQICDKTASSTTKTANVTILSNDNSVEFAPV